MSFDLQYEQIMTLADNEELIEVFVNHVFDSVGVVIHQKTLQINPTYQFGIKTDAGNIKVYRIANLSMGVGINEEEDDPDLPTYRLYLTDPGF